MIGTTYKRETVRSTALRRVYTGYVDVEARHFFFWFFESRRNPDQDDVMLWLNGGMVVSLSIVMHVLLYVYRSSKLWNSSMSDSVVMDIAGRIFDPWHAHGTRLALIFRSHPF
jgi:hypothetical protein